MNNDICDISDQEYVSVLYVVISVKIGLILQNRITGQSVK